VKRPDEVAAGQAVDGSKHADDFVVEWVGRAVANAAGMVRRARRAAILP
jgi:hypothetical protein